MITTVTLNAAVDKLLCVDRFELDQVNRVRELHREPGGKGNNVAKVARLLGSEVTATGFLGGDTGAFVHNRLIERGIISDPVWISGETREALNVMDSELGTQTEVLEPGPDIQPEEWERMKTKIEMLSAASSVVCFSGSLPRSVPEHAYADLIQAAKSAGALTILDTSGPGFTGGIEGAPFMCKPNRAELAQWCGRPLESIETAVEESRLLLRRGVRVVVVSLDEEGSILVTDHEAWRICPPRIEAVNTVGCGDSLIGGIAHFLDRSGAEPPVSELLEALIWGSAAAASNAMFPIAGHIEASGVRDLLEKVVINRL